MTTQNNDQNQKQHGDNNNPAKPGQQSQSPANDGKQQGDQKKQDQAGAQKDSV